MDNDQTPDENIDNQPALEGEILTDNTTTHSKTVELRTVENVMEDSYLRYSMSVIVARALPDARWDRSCD